jgi:hypothetical protein
MDKFQNLSGTEYHCENPKELLLLLLSVLDTPDTVQHLNSASANRMEPALRILSRYLPKYNIFLLKAVGYLGVSSQSFHVILLSLQDTRTLINPSFRDSIQSSRHKINNHDTFVVLFKIMNATRLLTNT